MDAKYADSTANITTPNTRRDGIAVSAKAANKLWYVGAMNDAYFVIDQKPRPAPKDYDFGNHNTTVIAALGTNRKAADLIVAEHNERVSLLESSALDCAMCDASNSFVVSPLDGAVGYCFKEQRESRIRLGPAVCHICQKVVPTRYCEICDLRYCNEGEDDDRFCAIEHQNRHEDRLSSVDEVQRRMDAVVDAAVEWHQSGREGDNTWLDKAEILGAAIDSLLELRDKPATESSAASNNSDGTVAGSVQHEPECLNPFHVHHKSPCTTESSVTPTRVEADAAGRARQIFDSGFASVRWVLPLRCEPLPVHGTRVIDNAQQVIVADVYNEDVAQALVAAINAYSPARDAAVEGVVEALKAIQGSAEIESLAERDNTPMFTRWAVKVSREAIAAYEAQRGKQ